MVCVICMMCPTSGSKKGTVVQARTAAHLAGQGGAAYTPKEPVGADAAEHNQFYECTSHH